MNTIQAIFEALKPRNKIKDSPKDGTQTRAKDGAKKNASLNNEGRKAREQNVDANRIHKPAGETANKHAERTADRRAEETAKKQHINKPIKDRASELHKQHNTSANNQTKSGAKDKPYANTNSTNSKTETKPVNDSDKKPANGDKPLNDANGNRGNGKTEAPAPSAQITQKVQPGAPTNKPQGPPPYKVFLLYNDFYSICEAYKTPTEEMKALQDIFFQTIVLLDDKGVKGKLAYPRNGYTLGHTRVCAFPPIMDDPGVSDEERYEKIMSVRKFSIMIDDPEYRQDYGNTYHVQMGSKKQEKKDEDPAAALKLSGDSAWTKEKYIKTTKLNLSFYRYVKTLLYRNYGEIQVMDPSADRFHAFETDVMPVVLEKAEKVKSHPITQLMKIIGDDPLSKHRAACAMIRRMYDTGAISEAKLARMLRLDKSLEGVWFAAKTCQDEKKATDVRIIENLTAASACRIHAGQTETYINKMAEFCRSRNIMDVRPYLPAYSTYTSLMKDFVAEVNACADKINEKTAILKADDIKAMASAFIPDGDGIEEKKAAKRKKQAAEGKTDGENTTENAKTNANGTEPKTENVADTSEKTEALDNPDNGTTHNPGETDSAIADKNATGQGREEKPGETSNNDSGNNQIAEERHDEPANTNHGEAENVADEPGPGDVSDIADAYISGVPDEFGDFMPTGDMADEPDFDGGDEPDFGEFDGNPDEEPDFGNSGN